MSPERPETELDRVAALRAARRIQECLDSIPLDELRSLATVMSTVDAEDPEVEGFQLARVYVPFALTLRQVAQLVSAENSEQDRINRSSDGAGAPPSSTTQFLGEITGLFG